MFFFRKYDNLKSDSLERKEENMEHLVYCDVKSKVLEKILSGQKTMIVRGAAGRKLPFGRVFSDEVLYFVENDGSQKIKAKAIVESVINSDALTPEESIAMLEHYKHELNLSPSQLKRWGGKKRLCLISIKDAEVLTEPLVYDRQKNMDDWITVESIQTILEGQSEVYVSIRV